MPAYCSCCVTQVPIALAFKFDSKWHHLHQVFSQKCSCLASTPPHNESQRSAQERSTRWILCSFGREGEISLFTLTYSVLFTAHISIKRNNEEEKLTSLSSQMCWGASQTFISWLVWLRHLSLVGPPMVNPLECFFAMKLQCVKYQYIQALDQ